MAALNGIASSQQRPSVDLKESVSGRRRKGGGPLILILGLTGEGGKANSAYLEPSQVVLYLVLY